MKKQYITPQIERVCAVTINIMDFSITIDGRLFIIQKLFDKLGDYGGIRPMRILTTTKHVEVTQAYRLQPIVTTILLSPVLICTFS